MEVQLEEFRRADRRANLLDAYGPQGGNAEHGAELLGSLGDRPFTVMMEQPLQRRRCAKQGYVYFLPHDGYRHVDAFDTRENVGHQIAPLVGFGISSIRDLIVRRSVDVMEDGPRQSPPCQRAEIRDIVASIDTHWLLHLCELWCNRSKSCAWAGAVEAAREAALVLFNSVHITVSTICRI